MGGLSTEAPSAVVALPTDGVGEAERYPPLTRAWFVFFLLWMAGLAWAALTLFGRYEAGDADAARGWVLVLTVFYLSLCNTFVPLPTAWIVLLAATEEFGPVVAPVPRVLIVTVVATLGTVIANLNEYHLLASVFGAGLGARIRRTRVYGWAIGWFDRAPFTLLTLIALLPIPVDAVRWLAILRRYSRGRYALAYVVGRGTRYLLFAAGAVLLHLDLWTVILIQAGIILLAVLARLLVRPESSASHSTAA